MSLRKIVPPTMKELFIKEVERKILSGEWKIGDRLPTEREMAKETNVSRTVINSGLYELAQNGFVEIIPRKGVFVGDYIRNGQLNTLLSIINFNGGKFDKKTFDSLTSYRIYFDCECAYLAAQNRTDDDLKLMNSIYKKALESTNSTERFQLKFEFLHAIYCATGNNIYPLVCNSFKKLCITFNELIYRILNYEPIDYMAELIDTIEKKEPNEARKVMYAFLTERIDELKQVYFKD
ncbi:FadR/GntR family transcriptional regulator [Haloimpatiens lingqiaonensis]|uniref:FadR/GntR family transcriptional regulator n=1 Tax=Haloimpatiens lingqiaonensis TaxID=1380675 RepID=UPI0010FF4E06|nr:GntR family transcriptional regulator [Haloimpatiens lingqiaonensis]